MVWRWGGVARNGKEKEWGVSCRPLDVYDGVSDATDLQPADIYSN